MALARSRTVPSGHGLEQRQVLLKRGSRSLIVLSVHGLELVPSALEVCLWSRTVLDTHGLEHGSPGHHLRTGLSAVLHTHGPRATQCTRAPPTVNGPARPACSPHAERPRGGNENGTSRPTSTKGGSPIHLPM